MRIRCKLMGCACEGPCCHYCGADLYSVEFIQIGALGPLFEFVGGIRGAVAFLSHRCDVCRKRLWWTSDPTCEGQCAEDWVPF